MKRRPRRTAYPVPVDPDLERRWQAALLERPSNDPVALATWDETYGELLTTYQTAVTRAEEERTAAARTRTRLRRRVAAVVIGVLLVIGGIVYWANQPSEDEIRQAAHDQAVAACGHNYERAHHIKLVSKQIDLLQSGEGGWLEINPYGSPPEVGNVTLSPSDLQSGKTGEARVNNEAYVFDSSYGVGENALVERHGNRLVLTLFAYASGYGNLPHAALRVDTASPVTVQGESLSRVCFWG